MVSCILSYERRGILLVVSCYQNISDIYYIFGGVENLVDACASVFICSWILTHSSPQKKILVARAFSLQRQVIYQIKPKILNYLIKDFISSNFKWHLSVLLSNLEVSSLLLKLQPFRVVKYSLPFYCI